MKISEELLRQLRNAIAEELDAAGEDEVKQHPMYQRKASLVRRVDKLLARVKADA